MTGIPVTEVDVLDKRGHLPFAQRNYTHYFPIYEDQDGQPLNSARFYDDLVEAIQDVATKKVETYNPINDMVKIEYTVPVIGHLINHPTVYVFTPKSPLDMYMNPQEHGMYDKKIDHSMENTKDNRRKFRHHVLYNGQLYDVTQYYRKSGATLVPISHPFGYGPVHEPIWQKCHMSRIDQTQRRSDCMIYKFHRDQTFCGLRLLPEKMIFDSIHSDNSCKKSGCHKRKHHLHILKCEPGYVRAFELFYRSSDARDWISIGKFTGSSNESEIVDVSFDEISASEFKFVPIDYSKSFSKITCDFFAIGDNQIVKSEDEVVYSITKPRSGKYFTPESDFIDTYKVQKKSRHSKHRYSAHYGAHDRTKSRREFERIIKDTL
jgi:hypothetical protein